MKRALIGALILALAGCGASKDDEYIDKLAEVLDPDPTEQSEAGYIDLAHRWCERIADPATTQEPVDRAIADYAASAPDALSVIEVGLILGSAVEVYCPEDGARIRE